MSRHKVQVTIELSVESVEMLALVGAGATELDRAESALAQLADHATQGIYRPGAWERQWLVQVFGDDFVAKLEWGDPWGRGGSERSPFQRPRRAR
jgi:hypothetical protein